ncbi:hypothetical protein F5Y03DRAFT_194680 [Xylaria venustula]|nr:hypothetical protein F5Y03DRAFT_194680 [Xylaria venustula]
MAKTALNGGDVEMPGLRLDRVLHTSHDLENIMLTTRSILRGPLIPGRCGWPLQVVLCHRRSPEIVPSHRGVRLPTAISNRRPSPFPTRYVVYVWLLLRYAINHACFYHRTKSCGLGAFSPRLISMTDEKVSSFLLNLSRDISLCPDPSCLYQDGTIRLGNAHPRCSPSEMFRAAHSWRTSKRRPKLNICHVGGDRVVAAPGSLYLYEMAP